MSRWHTSWHTSWQTSWHTSWQVLLAARTRYVLAGLLLASLLPGSPLSAEDKLPFLSEQQQDWPSAISGYTTLVDNISAQDAYSPQLIEPLLGLGRSYLAVAELDAAEAALHRAQHLYHRNAGVLAAEQLNAVNLLIATHLQRRRPDLADQQQRFAHYLAIRNQDNPVDQLPAVYQLSAWYKETGQYQAARQLLNATIEQLNNAPKVAATQPALPGAAATRAPINSAQVDSVPVDSVPVDSTPIESALLENYLRLATIRQLEGNCCSYKQLEPAEAILAAHDGVSSAQQVEVYSALGDAYLLSEKTATANNYYRLAWQASDQAARDYFAAPREIVQAALLVTPDPRREVWLPATDRRMLGQSSGFGDFSGGRDSQFRKATMHERLALADLAPQGFTLPLNQNDYQVQIRESHNTNHLENVEPLQRMIGTPFQFNYAQLLYILPYSQRNAESLASFSIKMAFTVDVDGRLRDIDIQNRDLPPALASTMRKVLAKSRFRPRLVDGEPSPSQRVVLTQTFKSNG